MKNLHPRIHELLKKRDTLESAKSLIEDLLLIQAPEPTVHEVRVINELTAEIDAILEELEALSKILKRRQKLNPFRKHRIQN